MSCFPFFHKYKVFEVKPQVSSTLIRKVCVKCGDITQDLFWEKVNTEKLMAALQVEEECE